VSLATSWLEYVAVIAAAVGAVAAASGVIVAWRGPEWRAKRKAPKLVVSSDRKVRADMASRLKEAKVRIDNEAGRATAEAVEVSVTVSNKDVHGVHYVARQESLSFDTPRPDAPGRSTASVPSGSSRPVSFALVGTADKIAAHFPPHAYAQNMDRLQDNWAALSLCSVERRKLFPWLSKGKAYDVELVVTGANFDAATYWGRIGLSEEEVPVNTVVPPGGTGQAVPNARLARSAGEGLSADPRASAYTGVWLHRCVAGARGTAGDAPRLLPRARADGAAITGRYRFEARLSGKSRLAHRCGGNLQ
jgi:hypothetical protein